MDEAYQLALKAEEKLNRLNKAAIKQGGSNTNKGRGSSSKPTSEAESSSELKLDFQGRDPLEQEKGEGFLWGLEALEVFYMQLPP